jgi:glucan-binding YG repeat protein
MRSLLFSISAVFVLLFGFSTNANAISGDKDCGDFSSKQAVMDFWYNYGYSASYDPHDLDRDNDGYPCEVSKGDYDNYLSNKSGAGTTPAYTGWKSSGGYWYYYMSGSLYKGWLQDAGSWYYFDQNGVMKTGWVLLGSTWYYFTSGGQMKTGWLYDGAWYYLNPGGEMAKGWVYDSGAWYYMNPNGAMKTGWYKEGNTWYYLTSGGSMATGWAKDHGAWYYFNQSGAMQTGWVYDAGSSYYLSGSGSMVTGWLLIGSDWYYFYSSGAMAKDTVVDGYHLNSEGKWFVPTTVVNGFFDSEKQLQIENLYPFYNLSYEYEEDYNTLNIYDEEGYEVVEVVNGYVIGYSEYADLIAELALIVEAPIASDELVELFETASVYGYADSGQVIVRDTYEGIIDVYWGQYYAPY